MSDEEGTETLHEPRAERPRREDDPLPRVDAESIVQRLLATPDALQALGQVLAPLAEQTARSTGSERDREARGYGPPRACARMPPGNAAVHGGDAQAGLTTPNAGYTGAQAGLDTPNAGYARAQAGLYAPTAECMNPHTGYAPPRGGFPWVPVPIQLQAQGQVSGMGIPPNPGQFLPAVPPFQQYYWEAGRHQASTPSSSSAGPGTSAQTHEDTISPYLSSAENREFRETESETDSEEEEEPKRPRERFKLSAQTASLLAEVSAKPLKNTKHRQLLDQFPSPAECDQAYPPKLDESISLIIPDSSKKEDRSLSRLQQFTMDSLGAMLSLQEQLMEEKPTDLKDMRAAVKTSITLLGNAVAHFNLERRKCVMKHLNKDLQPLVKGAYPNRGPWLFGEDFGTKAKSMADSIKALKSTLGKRKAPFSNSGGPTKKQKYPSQNPRGRRMYGVPPHQYSAGSIFQRLGPQRPNKPTKMQVSGTSNNK